MKTTQAAKTPSIGLRGFLQTLFGPLDFSLSHNPLSSYININGLCAYPWGKKSTLPSFTKRVYAIKNSLQITCLELVNSIIKGSIIHFSIKELLKLLKSGKSISFYSLLPLALLASITKSVFKYWINNRKAQVEAWNLKALTTHTIDGYEKSSFKENATNIKNLSKDPSTRTFHELLLGISAFTFETYLYYLLLGGNIFLLTLSVSLVCLNIKAKIGDKITAQAKEVRDHESDLSTKTLENENKTLLRRGINLINHKFILNQWKLISKTLTDCINNAFSFGLILVTATLVFSGQYEIAIIVLQAQAAIEAFNSFTQYFELPTKWSALQSSTNDIVSTWGEDKNGESQKDFIFSKTQPDQASQPLFIRLLFYTLIFLGTLGLPLLSAKTSLIINVLLTNISLSAFNVSIIGLCFYSAFHYSTYKFKVEEISWKMVGMPILVTLSLSSLLVTTTLLQHLSITQILSPISPIMLICTLAITTYLDQYSYYNALYILKILATFLSQQTLEILRMPISFLHSNGIISKSFPEDSIINIDSENISSMDMPVRNAA